MQDGVVFNTLVFNCAMFPRRNGGGQVVNTTVTTDGTDMTVVSSSAASPPTGNRNIVALLTGITSCEFYSRHSK